jgi:hypothetical protein
MPGQLVIHVGGHPTYGDGDILHAFSPNEIRRKWAELICKQKAPELYPFFLSKTRVPGGPAKLDMATYDEIWQHIESETAYREADYPFWPWGENRRFLVVATNDFTDAQMAEFESPLIDDSDPNPENWVTLAKRKCFIPWRSGLVALGVTEADVLDRFRAIDVLHVQLNTDIVQVKTA